MHAKRGEKEQKLGDFSMRYSAKDQETRRKPGMTEGSRLQPSPAQTRQIRLPQLQIVLPTILPILGSAATYIEAGERFDTAACAS